MKQSQHKKQLQIEKSILDPSDTYYEIEKRVGHLAKVNHFPVDLGFAFSVSFVQLFLSDTPNYELTKGVYGASRSNWTYHTAMAIAQTCKMLDLVCKFETLGKRDAVIETRDETPTTVLIAEWEWDYEDIFGKGKELDKLKSSCKASKTTDGFLLVYCPNSKYPDYMQRIAEFWIGAMRSQKVPSTLFLHTIIFEDRGAAREFEQLRTVEINPEYINVWSDQYF